MKKTILPILVSLLIAFSANAATNRPILPDTSLTPGIVNKDSTDDKLCTVGYTGTIRNVPESIKKKVFAEYNINSKSGKFEIDHLISLEIGGSNDIKNLWPESYTTKPFNAHIKDKLENKLHKMICNKTISKEEAQKEISEDWILTYCTYYDDMKKECNLYMNSK